MSSKELVSYEGAPAKYQNTSGEWELNDSKPSKRYIGLQIITYAAVGVFCGLVIGLSNSPVVSTTIASAFVFLGHYFTLKFKPENSLSSLTAQPNHIWLLPFTLFAITGILAGITLKANNLLEYRSVKDRLIHEIGFSSKQSEKILERWTNEVRISDAQTEPRTVLLNDIIPVNSKTASWKDRARKLIVLELRKGLGEEKVFKSLSSQFKEEIGEIQGILGDNPKAIIDEVLR